MSSTCFISDLHLDPDRPAITRALAHLLQHRPACSQLYILGDLFEAWPGDDEDCAVATEVIDLLRHYSANGAGLFIMCGNRDFLLGERFCSAIGATLLPDPTVIDLYGEPTLLMHGDSLCIADADYQRFRRDARDPAWQAQLMTQPLAERRVLATRLRAMSREANSIKSKDIMDVTVTEVERVMAAYGVRQLIHGHTHRPARHGSHAGIRWVLGAWEKHGWVIDASPGKINLNKFDIIQ